MEPSLSEPQQEALDDIHLACYDAVEETGDIYSLANNFRPEVQEKVDYARSLYIPESFIVAVINRFTLKDAA